MAALAQKQMILQKYYIYDPGVTAGEELGGLRVRIDDDEKGNYVLAPYLTMQYWVDAGLAGDKPVGELSGEAKTLLAQITRGRSENPDDRPRRVARLEKRGQSGAPSLYNDPPSVVRSKRRKAQKKDQKNDKQAKKPEPKKPEQRQAPILGVPAE